MAGSGSGWLAWFFILRTRSARAARRLHQYGSRSKVRSSCVPFNIGDHYMSPVQARVQGRSVKTSTDNLRAEPASFKRDLDR